MARLLPVLCLALLQVSMSLAKDKHTLYSQLGSRYTLSLAYGTEWQGPSSYSTPAPCLNFNPTNSTCLPQVNPDNGNCIKITYGINSTVNGAVLNTTSTIRLVACFSPYSSLNRGWRKANPLIDKDLQKQCSVKIANGLPPGNGSYTWCPTDNTAPATMRIRLLEQCADGDNYKFCATGVSPGFFQIDATVGRPTWMLACIGVFAAIGPVTLALFFIWEFKYKKA